MSRYSVPDSPIARFWYVPIACLEVIQDAILQVDFIPFCRKTAHLRPGQTPLPGPVKAAKHPDRQG